MSEMGLGNCYNRAMKSAKRETLAYIETLPEDISVETILYRLHVRAKVERGLAEIERGETIPHEQVMEDLERWLASIGQ